MTCGTCLSVWNDTSPRRSSWWERLFMLVVVIVAVVTLRQVLPSRTIVLRAAETGEKTVHVCQLSTFTLGRSTSSGDRNRKSRQHKILKEPASRDREVYSRRWRETTRQETADSKTDEQSTKSRQPLLVLTASLSLDRRRASC